MQSIALTSEYAQLKTVILHRPGAEIDRLLPDNYRTYLFEDIPYLTKLQREHDDFANIIRSHGAQVRYTRDLITETLQNPAAREILIQATTTYERCEPLAEDLLRETPENLTEILICGLRAEEARERGMQVSKYLSDERIMIPPLPNMYFMRDPAAVVGDCIISSNMYYAARGREAILMEHIFKYHPDFLRSDAFVFGVDEDERYPYTIEGGDILVISDEAIAVGRSERTSTDAIGRLAVKLFQRGVVKRLYEVFVPLRREYMHLDTVFTILAPQTIIAHKGSLSELPQTRVYEAAPASEQGYTVRSERSTILDVLRDEFGQLSIIEVAGGDKYYADREQRTDGANVFTIAPGKVIGYDRNQMTNKALRAEGVEVLEFDGSELVRGLGGARCMTMPIERAAL
jgi:arginine deiminase